MANGTAEREFLAGDPMPPDVPPCPVPPPDAQKAHLLIATYCLRLGLGHDHQKQARPGMAGLCTAVSAGTAGSTNDSGWLETAITPTKPASAANAETEPLEFATPTLWSK
jgi:hypothetical protein